MNALRKGFSEVLTLASFWKFSSNQRNRLAQIVWTLPNFLQNGIWINANEFLKKSYAIPCGKHRIRDKKKLSHLFKVTTTQCGFFHKIQILASCIDVASKKKKKAKYWEHYQSHNLAFTQLILISCLKNYVPCSLVLQRKLE